MNRYRELLAECQVEEAKEPVENVEEAVELEESEEDIVGYVERLASEIRQVLDTLGFELSESDATPQEVLEAVDEFLVEEDLEKDEQAILEDYWSELKSVVRLVEGLQVEDQELDEVTIKAGTRPEDLARVVRALRAERPPRPPKISGSPKAAQKLRDIFRDASGRAKLKIPAGAQPRSDVPQPPGSKKDEPVASKKKKVMIGLPGYRRELARKLKKAVAGAYGGSMRPSLKQRSDALAQRLAGTAAEPKQEPEKPQSLDLARLGVAVRKGEKKPMAVAQASAERKRKEGWPSGSSIIRKAIRKARAKPLAPASKKAKE